MSGVAGRRPAQRREHGARRASAGQTRIAAARRRSIASGSIVRSNPASSTVAPTAISRRARHEVDVVAHHGVAKRRSGEREHLSFERANRKRARQAVDRGRPGAGGEDDRLAASMRLAASVRDAAVRAARDRASRPGRPRSASTLRLDAHGAREARRRAARCRWRRRAREARAPCGATTPARARRASRVRDESRRRADAVARPCCGRDVDAVPSSSAGPGRTRAARRRMPGSARGSRRRTARTSAERCPIDGARRPAAAPERAPSRCAHRRVSTRAPARPSSRRG